MFRNHIPQETLTFINFTLSLSYLWRYKFNLDISGHSSSIKSSHGTGLFSWHILQLEVDASSLLCDVPSLSLLVVPWFGASVCIRTTLEEVLHRPSHLQQQGDFLSVQAKETDLRFAAGHIISTLSCLPSLHNFLCPSQRSGPKIKISNRHFAKKSLITITNLIS